MANQSRIGTHATTVARDSDGVLRVTYHSTPVVTVYPNGRIVLDHGGYMSPTTKTRMNQAANQLSLGFRVYQQDFDWHILIDGHDLEWGHERRRTIRNGSDAV